MESKSYKELQALAKLHGIRANLSKAALIVKLADCSTPGGSVDKLRDEVDTPKNGSNTPEDNIDEHVDVSDCVPGTAIPDVALDKVQWDAAPLDRVEPEVTVESSGKRKSDRLSAAKTVTPAPLDGVEPEVPVEGPERRKSDRLSAAKTVTPAPLDRVEPEVPVEAPERRKSDRLSAAKTVTHAPLDRVEPEVPVESSERRKSDRLSAAKMESQTSNELSGKTKTKVRQPTAGSARRFERMHQNLFAGQASIETYGKTPKKKTVPAKENVRLSKVTPVRSAACGSGVKSAKRGLTVASKPCTLVVQRSSKKPTQIKEFRLSSNQSGRREPFKPYSGPVRPMNIANKPTSFSIGSSSSASAQVPKENKTKLGIKATLASGMAKSARKNAHVESRKLHRERVVAEARFGRA